MNEPLTKKSGNFDQSRNQMIIICIIAEGVFTPVFFYRRNHGPIPDCAHGGASIAAAILVAMASQYRAGRSQCAAS